MGLNGPSVLVSQQHIPPPLGTQRVAAAVLKDNTAKNTRAIIFFISIPLLVNQESLWRLLSLGLVVYQLR